MTTAALYYSPFIPAFSNVGVTIAESKLYFYYSGGAILAPIYSDAALTVPLTNPVQSNLAGKYPNIYLDAATLYRVRQTDKNDVPIGDDVDPYLSPPGSLFIQAGAGAAYRTMQDKGRDIVSVKDFGAIGNGVADDTTKLQAALDSGLPLYIPAGTYKITAPLVVSNTFSAIRGAGAEQSIISCNGVAGGAFVAAAILYLRPLWSDFAITGNAATGRGIDFSAVTSEVFNGALERLRINVGGDGIYALRFFSMKVDSVVSSSVNGHSFRVACGPGVSWINCYATQCGATKAGYRLGGTISLYSCNGIDGGGWWGIFGQEPTAADGYQADFPGAGPDYPVVTMIDCNVEAFPVGGIFIHSAYKAVRIMGGTIDRSSLATPYNSIIRLGAQPLVGGAPVVLSVGSVNKGAGVPNGGGALTTAWVYAVAGQPSFFDETGTFVAQIPKYYSTVYADMVPIASMSVASDMYQDLAVQFSAISPRRLTLQAVRYKTNTLTPVGAGQAIDVTGYAKVIVTPAAAASITTATFTQTYGGADDFGRNGELVIEAGNANLTINHTARGGAANTFIMAAGSNLALASGQIVRFLRSETGSQWQQV